MRNCESIGRGNSWLDVLFRTASRRRAGVSALRKAFWIKLLFHNSYGHTHFRQPLYRWVYRYNQRMQALWIPPDARTEFAENARTLCATYRSRRA